MLVIKTSDGRYIKPDGKVSYVIGQQHYWCYGHRWNKNEGKWSKLAIAVAFDRYEEIDLEEKDLPTIKPLDID